jgi:dCMP deaminase
VSTTSTAAGSRPSTDEYFLRMAELVATRATCIRRSVGCVLVDANNHVLATGYNGVACGRPHCNEPTLVSGGPNAGRVKFHHKCAGADAPSGTNLSGCEAIHAEENALIQCRDVDRIATIYCTASPCVLCMRKILNTSAKRIVFREEYPHAESRQLAADAGIEWCRCP